MISTRQMALIALAAVAGFALTMGGWNPAVVSPGGVGVRFSGGFDGGAFDDGLYRLSTCTSAGFAAAAAFLVLRRPD